MKRTDVVKFYQDKDRKDCVHEWKTKNHLTYCDTCGQPYNLVVYGYYPEDCGSPVIIGDFKECVARIKEEFEEYDEGECTNIVIVKRNMTFDEFNNLPEHTGW